MTTTNWKVVADSELSFEVMKTARAVLILISAGVHLFAQAILWVGHFGVGKTRNNY